MRLHLWQIKKEAGESWTEINRPCWVCGLTRAKGRGLKIITDIVPQQGILCVNPTKTIEIACVLPNRIIYDDWDNVSFFDNEEECIDYYNSLVDKLVSEYDDLISIASRTRQKLETKRIIR